ncbi:MAG: phosphatase PAP2 family protein [archaeon]
MMFEIFEAIDSPIHGFLSLMNNNFLFLFFLSITYSLIPVILLTSFYYFMKNKKVIAITLLLGFLFVFLSMDFLKDVFERPRPPNDLEKGYSFPSTHAGIALFLAHFVSRNENDRKVKISLYTYAGLVSFSRLYLGVHYFTDVIFGAILGVIFAEVFLKIMKVYKG